MNRLGTSDPDEAIRRSCAPEPSPPIAASQLEEALIFEIGRPEVTGVDLDEPAPFESRLGGLEREAPIGLPGLSEPEAMRHYVRLSQKNYSIDAGLLSARLLHDET